MIRPLVLLGLAPLLPCAAGAQEEDRPAPVTAPAAEPRGARTHWVVPTTAGYGAAGTALAVVALLVGEAEFGPALVVLPTAGAVGGAIAGYQIGHRADRTLARGAPLSPAHRWAVRAGTVFTGAALGTGAAIVLINPEGPSPLGSDETILAGSVLGGAALGALVQLALDRRLSPSPRVRVGAAPSARGGMQLTMRLALR